MSFFTYFFSPFQSKISINDLDSNDSKCNDTVVRNTNLNVDAFCDEAEDSNATTVTITNRLLESNVLRVLGEESIESSVSEEVAVIDDSDSVNFNDMSNSFSSELFSSGNYKYILKGVPIDQSKKSIQNALKACISADHRLYNLLTTITVEYFLYNLADGSLCHCGNFAKF
jgi:hypothetical protein